MKNFVESKFKGGFYSVKEGETLIDLEQKFLTSARLIALENNLQRDVVSGEIIYITIYEKAYVVKVLDTIYDVEKALGATFNEIARINKISYVYPFMKLVM